MRMGEEEGVGDGRDVQLMNVQSVIVMVVVEEEGEEEEEGRISIPPVTPAPLPPTNAVDVI